MGPAQADRALDNPNLAVRVRDRSSRLFNALPMVPSTAALTAVRPLFSADYPSDAISHALRSHLRTRLRRAVQRTLQPLRRKSLRRQNLALDGDLMFHQSDMPPRREKTLW